MTTTPTRHPDVGAEGNSRLTAVTGMLLLVLLAVEGVTILSIRLMITVHIYLGLLLGGPVLLKTASTTYRVARYYTGARPYRAKGPPHLILRTLGPVVIVTSLAVLGTGVGLIAAGPTHREPLLTLHKASFLVWFAAMSLHVLGHLADATRTTWRELREPHAEPTAPRRRARTLAVALALIAGVGLATVLLPAAHGWTSQHSTEFDRHDNH